MSFVELIRNVKTPWAHIAAFVNQDLNQDQPLAQAVNLTVVLHEILSIILFHFDLNLCLFISIN